MEPMTGVTTLGQFIIARQKDFPYAKGELSRLLRDISIAAKIVNSEIRKAGVANILGSNGNINVHGEDQKTLDVYANRQFITALRSGGECCGIASEENKDFIPIHNDVSSEAKYVVCIDPLDGSSNIDVNVSIGTIFSIYRRVSGSGPATREDFLQKGSCQVAAGYVLYGSSTMLVYTTGHGVNGFTLIPSIGEFCLSHPNIRVPEKGIFCSVNEGNFTGFPEGVKKFIQKCKEETDPENAACSFRYTGSLVADFHRNLIKGGIYMYPPSVRMPEGKLRLSYECNPLAFIIEQAGGKATDGNQRILDIEPKDVHQRTSLYIGSSDMINQVETLINEESGRKKQYWLLKGVISYVPVTGP